MRFRVHILAAAALLFGQAQGPAAETIPNRTTQTPNLAPGVIANLSASEARNQFFLELDLHLAELGDLALKPRLEYLQENLTPDVATTPQLAARHVLLEALSRPKKSLPGIAETLRASGDHGLATASCLEKTAQMLRDGKPRQQRMISQILDRLRGGFLTPGEGLRSSTARVESYLGVLFDGAAGRIQVQNPMDTLIARPLELSAAKPRHIQELGEGARKARELWSKSQLPSVADEASKEGAEQRRIFGFHRMRKEWISFGSPPPRLGNMRRWAAEFSDLRIESARVAKNGHLNLRLLGHVAVVGKANAGKLASILFTWSEAAQFFILHEILIDDGGRIRPMPYKMVWGRSAPDQEYALVGSFLDSLHDGGRRWGRKFPELRIGSSLDKNGKLSLFGQANKAAFTFHPNMPVDVYMRWSDATQRYVPWEVAEAGEEPKHSFPFRTIWGKRSADEDYALLDSHRRVNSNWRRIWSSEDYPEIKLVCPYIKDGIGFMDQDILHQIPPKFTGGSAAVFMSYSTHAKRYLPTHMQLLAANGKDSATLWFTLILDSSEPSEAFVWNPSPLKQTIYGGGQRWWWLEKRSQIATGDIAWIPWSFIGNSIYLAPKSATLYRFNASDASPMYGVYRKASDGEFELLGAWAGDLWVQAHDLSKYRARLTARQQYIIEHLWREAESKWSREPDVLQSAIAAASVALIQGLDEAAVHEQMLKAARKEKNRIRLMLLEDIGYRTEFGEADNISRVADKAPSVGRQAVQRIERKILGTKLAAILPAPQLAALVYTYDMDPIEFGWTLQLQMTPQEHPKLKKQVESALRRLRRAVQDGLLSEKEFLEAMAD